jgi:hypothetical protein
MQDIIEINDNEDIHEINDNQDQHDDNQDDDQDNDLYNYNSWLKVNFNDNIYYIQTKSDFLIYISLILFPIILKIFCMNLIFNNISNYIQIDQYIIHFIIIFKILYTFSRFIKAPFYLFDRYNSISVKNIYDYGSCFLFITISFLGTYFYSFLIIYIMELSRYLYEYLPIFIAISAIIYL